MYYKCNCITNRSGLKFSCNEVNLENLVRVNTCLEKVNSQSKVDWFYLQ